MNLLHTLGLMTRKEHERRLRDAAFGTMTVEVHKELIAVERAKFKRATTDLAAQAEEIARLNREVDGKIGVIDKLYERIDALKPDAEAMRKKRDADRKRMAGKRNG